MLRDSATKCANSSGVVLPNKKTAVRRNIRRNSGYLSHVARQRNEMRPSSGVIPSPTRFTVGGMIVR